MKTLSPHYGAPQRAGMFRTNVTTPSKTHITLEPSGLAKPLRMSEGGSNIVRLYVTHTGFLGWGQFSLIHRLSLGSFRSTQSCPGYRKRDGATGTGLNVFPQGRVPVVTVTWLPCPKGRVDIPRTWPRKLLRCCPNLTWQNLRHTIKDTPDHGMVSKDIICYMNTL